MHGARGHARTHDLPWPLRRTGTGRLAQRAVATREVVETERRVPDDARPEALVHASALSRSGLDELLPGQSVSVRARRLRVAFRRRRWSCFDP